MGNNIYNEIKELLKNNNIELDTMDQFLEFRELEKIKNEIEAGLENLFKKFENKEIDFKNLKNKLDEIKTLLTKNSKKKVTKKVEKKDDKKEKDDKLENTEENKNF